MLEFFVIHQKNIFDGIQNMFRMHTLWIRMGDKWLQSGKWWDRMVSMWEKVGSRENDPLSNMGW